MAAGSVSDGATMFVVGSFVAACSVKVERLPQAGETLRAESFTLEAGGKGFNVAVAAHRLGVPVEGVLGVGDDAFASFAAATLAQVGLPATMLVGFPGPTGAGVGFVDAAGENCIAVCPAANDLLSEREIAAASVALCRARLVVAQFEVGDPPILAAFAAGGEVGALRVLNPSPFRPLPPGLLSMTDVLVVNESEAAMLARSLEMPEPRAIDGPWSALAQHVLTLGPKIVVVTRGAAGVLAWTVQESLSQPAFAVLAVDTIGAGDAFLGGLCAAFWDERPLDEALIQAAACGAIATMQVGLLQALTTSDVLANFLEHARR